MIIVYSAYSSELFRECCQATTLFFTSAPLTLLSCFKPHIILWLWDTSLLLRLLFWVVSQQFISIYHPIIFCSAYSSELFRQNRTFLQSTTREKTQLLWMHSYYMAYSCINCQILLHRIILTCSFSSANPTAILWVLNVRAPW